jgi:hypothetical protein
MNLKDWSAEQKKRRTYYRSVEQESKKSKFQGIKKELIETRELFQRKKKTQL